MAKALEDLTPKIVAAIEAKQRPCEILAAFPISRTRLYELRRSLEQQQQTAA
ncbi:hypothetical protein AVDCRST_MAG94-376 [uncultured Leptolyngbya sp.]|uniref:Uncharacterized protein n=1 Tax=uncultured Leptolyngbya sp. TaxID=332963 RepID=A0A6J4KCT5_9CYAN|nr:hypothetical protein AVDCRST_MAG94-376 [uncultured Leptolyngbya sp.]